MRVRVDGDQHPQLGGPPGLDIVQVGPLRGGVDLDRLAMAPGRLEDLLEVHVVRVSLADEPARRVGQDVHVGVRQCRADPPGHLGLRLLEPRVDGADDEIELGEDVVGVVHGPVGQDIALAARQDPDPGMVLLDGADLLDLGSQLVGGEPARDGGGPAVIGHDDVLVSARAGRLHQRLDAVSAVGRIGVDVEVAADIARLDQPGKLPSERGLDLARVLPKLGRDPREPDRRVHLFLRLAGHALATGIAEDAVLGDLEPLPHGHLADADIVLLGAGEVDERGAEGLGLDHAQVDLDPFAKPRRSLGASSLQHLRDLGQARERVHDLLGLRGGDEDVDVADRFLPAADRSGQTELLDLRHALERPVELFGHGQRAPERHALLALLDHRDALEDVGLGLGLDARQSAELARLGQRLQGGDVADTRFVVEQLRGPGAQTGDVHQLDHAVRDLLVEGVHVLHPARPQVLADLVGEVLADAGDLAQPLLLRDHLDVLAEAFETLAGATVGADAEGIVSADLQEIGHPIEETGDLDVLHAALQFARERLSSSPNCSPPSYRLTKGLFLIQKRQGLSTHASA